MARYDMSFSSFYFQLKLMEQQLAAMNWKPQDLENRIHELEESCGSKDRQIKDLEIRVDEQVYTRTHDKNSSWYSSITEIKP